MTKADKEGNKRKLEEDGGEDVAAPAARPKKKKAKVASPTDESKAEEQLINEANEVAGKTAAEDEPATPKSAKKKNKSKKTEGAVAATTESPSAPAAGDKVADDDDTTKPAAAVDAAPTEIPADPLPASDVASDASEVSSEPQSSTFDDASHKPAETASSTTSVSSAIPASDKPKHIKIPQDTAAFRERFASRLATLRAARKADGPDGKPVRTRQELIEQRRHKEMQRKEHKKEMRRLAKLEEDEAREEALKANSPSVMSPGDELDENTANFSFGRVAFGDGTQLSHDLSYVLTRDAKKGPSDPKTALLRMQNQKKRLAGMDEEKRKDIEDKEAWLTARRRAEGEKVRDDEGMLKKAVKRKERVRKRSEKEWKDRKSAVELGIKQRQKKREENLRKRRDEKGGKGKKKAGLSGVKTARKSRPGFEGKFGGKK